MLRPSDIVWRSVSSSASQNNDLSADISMTGAVRADREMEKTPLQAVSLLWLMIILQRGVQTLHKYAALVPVKN